MLQMSVRKGYQHCVIFDAALPDMEDVAEFDVLMAVMGDDDARSRLQVASRAPSILRGHVIG